MQTRIAKLLAAVAIIVWILGGIVGVAMGATAMSYTDAFNIWTMLLYWIIFFIVGTLYYGFAILVDHVAGLRDETSRALSGILSQVSQLALVMERKNAQPQPAVPASSVSPHTAVNAPSPSQNAAANASAPPAVSEQQHATAPSAASAPTVSAPLASSVPTVSAPSDNSDTASAAKPPEPQAVPQPPVSGQIFCPYCGKKQDSDRTTCYWCGAKFIR